MDALYQYTSIAKVDVVEISAARSISRHKHEGDVSLLYPWKSFKVMAKWQKGDEDLTRVEDSSENEVWLDGWEGGDGGNADRAFQDWLRARGYDL